MRRLNFAEFGNNDRAHTSSHSDILIIASKMFKLHVFIFVALDCAKHLMVYISFEMIIA